MTFKKIKKFQSESEMHQYPIIDCCFVVGVVWPCTSIENRNQNPAPLKNVDTRHLSRIPGHEMSGLCFYLHYWCNCCSVRVVASFLSCDPSFHPEKSSRNQSGNCVWQIANVFVVLWSYFQMPVCSVKLFFWLKSLVCETLNMKTESCSMLCTYSRSFHTCWHN